MTDARSPFSTQSQTLAARLSRRAGLGAAAAALAALAAPKLGAAKRRRVAAEHNVRGNKAVMCVDGATRKVPKKRRKAYLKQGATRGECATACPTGQKSCDGACIANTACCTNADCTSLATCKAGVCTAPGCGTGAPCTVFATSSTFTGNLGGLAGADSKCQAAATAAGLTGTYLAWLSDAGNTPATRFSNTSQAGPYVLVRNSSDGSNSPPTVAANFAALTSCSGGGKCLQHAIDRTESGSATTTVFTWTGTDTDGTANINTCSGWSADSIVGGRVGVTAQTDSYWTSGFSVFCYAMYALYCFEQAEA
ncbi:MAG: DUF1554 domain-containing protein [Thermomicrobiales bacterium]